MGPTGSGKTTLLKVASGFLKPDKGKVKLLGVDIYGLSQKDRIRFLRKNVSFMPQEDVLIWELTLFENVELPLLISGVPKKKRWRIVEDALSLVELDGLENRLPSEVSGGERRRILLARSLVFMPKILFADEPTSNLDSKTALRIVDKLLELNKEHGLTLLVSTHDPLVAEKLGKTILIRDGKLVEK
jgi:putative ABC transport system ATP-binding protein